MQCLYRWNKAGSQREPVQLRMEEIHPKKRGQNAGENEDRTPQIGRPV